MSNETTENQEMTPEDFKLRVLKQRFAERITELEETIANLATQYAQLQQENQRLQQLVPQDNDSNEFEAKSPGESPEA